MGPLGYLEDFVESVMIEASDKISDYRRCLERSLKTPAGRAVFWTAVGIGAAYAGYVVAKSYKGIKAIENHKRH